MLQRIQTVYLTGAILLSIVLFFVDYAIVFPANEFNKAVHLGVSSFDMPDTTIEKPASYPALLVLNVLIILFSTYAIFKFRNRNQQIKITRLSLFLSLLLLGGMFLYTDVVKQKVTEAHVSYMYGIIFPIVQSVLIFLAATAIKKDDDLVRSADRLR